MGSEIKVDEIPYHAHNLYVKLYCERKGVKDKKTIAEAKKSWSALSSVKKDRFYKTSAKRNLMKYAHTLSKTEAYVKEKNPKKRRLEKLESIERQDEELITDRTVVSISDNTQPENALHPFIPDESMEIDAPINLSEAQNNNETRLAEEHETRSNVDSDDASTVLIRLDEQTAPDNETRLAEGHETRSNVDSDDASTVLIRLDEQTAPEHNARLTDVQDRESNGDSNEASAAFSRLCEPTPPSVNLGRDLYEMVAEPGHIPWREVHRRQQEHYNRAVRALKREYLNNYIMYLEHLPQRELFDHYMKTLH